MKMEDIFINDKDVVEGYISHYISQKIIQIKGKYYIQYDEDGVYCNVYGDIIINDLNLNSSLIRFKKVTGNFTLRTSMKFLSLNTLCGSPEEVLGDVIISLPDIYTLEYLPRKIGGSLSCYSCSNLLGTYNESEIKNTCHISPITPTVSEDNAVDFIKWLLEHSPDIQNSLNWLSKANMDMFLLVRELLYNNRSKYSNILNYDLDIGINEDLKKIGKVAISTNHRM